MGGHTPAMTHPLPVNQPVNSSDDSSTATISPVGTVDSLARGEFMDDLSRAGISASNRKPYLWTVTHAAKDRGWIRPKDITTQSIGQWLAKRRRDDAISGHTHNNQLGHLRRFCRFLRTIDLMVENPTDGIERASESDARKGTRSYNTEEVLAILKVAADPVRPEDSRCDTTRVFAYKLFAMTGLRRRELRLLEWEMIDLDPVAPMMRLPGWLAKAQAHQNLPLSPECVEVLTELYALTGKSKRVLPWGIPSYQTLKSDLKRAGVSELTAKGRSGFHGFRKWYCSMNARNCDAPVLKTLGRHADIRTTMKCYVDSDLVEAHQKLGMMPRLRLDPASPPGATPDNQPVPSEGKPGEVPKGREPCPDNREDQRNRDRNFTGDSEMGRETKDTQYGRRESNPHPVLGGGLAAGVPLPEGITAASLDLALRLLTQALAGAMRPPPTP